MRAITVSTPGPPDALHEREVPLPEPGPGQVLVQVHAAGVNPVDLWVRRGSFHELGVITSSSVGVGIDLAGVVHTHSTGLSPQLAEAVPVGARVAAVLALSDAPSLAYAEYVVVPAADLALVPEGLSMQEAATVPLNALTAMQAVDLLGPAQGRSLLVTGAAGAVGTYVTQFGLESGFTVSALARAADEPLLASLGAKPLTEIPARVFDVVVDTAVLGERAAGLVVDAGTYLGVLPTYPLPARQRIVIQTVSYRPDGRALTGLLQRTADGQLLARVAHVLPLRQAAEAHRLLEAGGLRGRIVLTP